MLRAVFRIAPSRRDAAIAAALAIASPVERPPVVVYVTAKSRRLGYRGARGG
jgi:hypothetical protein